MIGKCYYCNKELNKRGVKQHLKSCKEIKNRIELGEKKGKDTRNCFIVSMVPKYVEAEYFIYFLIDETLTLEHMDKFIRDVWVECCGHLSEFNIENMRFERSKNVVLSDVLEVGSKFDYIYDFGSTTELKLQVIQRIEVPNNFSRIEIMVRNNEVVHSCAKCDKDAKNFDDNEYLWLCDHCIEDDDFVGEFEYTNSPRDGVCGYYGHSTNEGSYLPGNKTRFKKVNIAIRDKENDFDQWNENDELDFIKNICNLSDEEMSQHLYQGMQDMLFETMDREMGMLEKRFRKGKYSFDIKEILNSMTKEDLKGLASKHNYEKISKLKKDELTKVLIENYEEKITYIINLLDEKSFKIIKELKNNNGEKLFEKVESADFDKVMNLIGLGIAFPAIKGKDPIIIIPDIVQKIVDENNTLEHRRKVKVNTEIIELTTALVRVYGLLRLDKFIEILNKYIDYKNYDLIDIIKISAEDTMQYRVESGFLIQDDIENWAPLYIEINKNEDDYKYLTKEELMEFKDDDYIINNKYAKKMKKFLNSTFYIEEEQINLLIEKAYDDAQNGKLDEAYKEIRAMCEVEEISKEYIKVISKFANNLPIWTLKGKTINEVSIDNIEADKFNNVGRNDACPCGSTKKFKKCCGKNF